MEEITAEYEVQALAEAPKLEVDCLVEVACKTDLGRVRENNEDKFEFFIPTDEAMLAAKGQIFVVCDGMGGHAAGQIASEIAAKTFIDVYANHPSENITAALVSAITAANRYVLDVSLAVPSRRGMGTTLSALILLQGTAHIAHVGDSRVYRLRDGQLDRLTDDHTWVDEAIKRGEIPPEAAATHPYKHVITRAIGTEDSVIPDVFKSEAHEGDIYLLCSDGLTNHVPDDWMAQVLREFGPGEATWRLIGKALMEGGSDNCTVLIVRVAKLQRRPEN